jgi:hypothetical protein
VSSALAAGLSIDRDELVVPSLVVGIIAKAAVEPVITCSPVGIDRWVEPQRFRSLRHMAIALT